VSIPARLASAQKNPLFAFKLCHILSLSPSDLSKAL